MAMLGVPAILFAASDPDAQVEKIIAKSHQIQNQKRETAAVQAETSKVQAAYLKSLIKSSQSHARQQLVGAGSDSAKTTTANPEAVVSPTELTAPSDKVSHLQAQLDKFAKNNVSFQQQANQHIAALTEKDAMLQEKLAQLSQVLSMLNQEVGQLGSQIKAAQAQLKGVDGKESTNNKDALLSNFPVSNRVIQYSLYGVISLLAVIILLLLFRRGGQCNCCSGVCDPGCCNDSAVADSDDTSEEYDFMGSDESNPSKLDLARAYLAMEDFKAAVEVLDQVMKNGTPEQQAQANQMMKKVKK